MGWGVWKPGKRSPPALPAGALGGPAALATVPSPAHVLRARAAGPRVPAWAGAAQARPAGVSQHTAASHARHLRRSTQAGMPVATAEQRAKLVLKWLRSSGSPAQAQPQRPREGSPQQLPVAPRSGCEDRRQSQSL